MLRFMKFVTVAVVLSGFIVASPIWGQPIWLNQSQSNGNFLAVEFMKPSFKLDNDLTFLSSAWFVSGRFLIRNNLFLVGEIPIAHGKIDGEFGSSDSETILGNPYGGVEIRRSGSNIFGEIGLRVPIAADDKYIATGVGQLADSDRLEAFIPDVFAIVGRLNYQSTSASNIMFRLRGGPTLFTNADNYFEDNTELLIDYSVQVGFSGQMIIIVGGLTGRYFATADDGDFGEKSLHQLGVTASLNGRKVKPGVHFRLPLDDDLKDVIDFVFGLNLSVYLQ